ncbi:hypothetical protein OQA88_10293 [Cercophora sp. LCS_1]
MLFTLLTTAALATATPLKPRQWEGGPPISSAPGLILVANVTQPTKNIFNPPVNHWYLSNARIGPGKSAAVLSPNIADASLLFVNGTGQDRSSTNTAILAPPLDTNVGPIPMGLQFTRGWYGTYNGSVAYPGVNYGPGDNGARIGVRDIYARLFPPSLVGNGRFAVCDERDPVYGRPQYSVIWITYDGYTGEERPEPENCVEIELLAQCAELPPLAGVDELGIINIGSLCYENVAAIDWSQWR